MNSFGANKNSPSRNPIVSKRFPYNEKGNSLLVTVADSWVKLLIYKHDDYNIINQIHELITTKGN